MSISVELQLMDRVSKDAYRIASALGEIGEQAKRTDELLGRNFGKKLQTSYLTNYFKQLKKEMKGVSDAAAKPLKVKVDKADKDRSQALSAGALVAANIFTDAIIGGIKLFYNGVKDAMDLVGKAEQTEIGLKYTAPYARQYIKQDVNAYSGITGQGQEQTKQQLLPIIRSLGDHADADTIARQVREAASDISVMSGRGTQDIQSILDTFEKINQREGLQSRQLINLGINEKEFYTLLGKNLGITEEAAKKSAAKGKNSDAVRNTLLTLVANKEGGRTGNATNDYAESFQGRVEKLKSLPEDFLAGLQGTPVLKEINDQLGQTYKWVMDNKEQIAGGLLQALKTVDNVLKDVLNPENIKIWIGYFNDAVGVFKFVGAHLDGIVTTLEVMAVAMTAIKTIGFATTLIEVLPTLGTLLGASAAAAVTLAAPILAIAAALGAVYYAYKKIKEEIGNEGRDDISHFSAGNENAVSDPNRINEFSPQAKKDKYNARRAANGEIPLSTESNYGAAPPSYAVDKNKGMVIAPVIQIDATNSNFSSEEDRDQFLQKAAQQTNDAMTQLLNQSQRQSGN